MTISRAPGLGNVTRLEELTARRVQRPRGKAPHHVKRTETLHVSERAQALRGQRELLERILGGAETGIREVEEALEKAGKSAYLESIESPADLSPEATAERILGGITGYIYGAFRLESPDATAEDFERFQAKVLEGFGRGLAEAKDTLEGLALLSDALVGSIDVAETRVRDGLEEFFAGEAENY
ncbi:MAG: DUF5610 domain-containing protein [Myxococcota bacterium]